MAPFTTTNKIILGLSIGFATTLVSAAVVTAVLVWLPRDYFVDKEHRPDLHPRHPAVRVTLLVAKNLLGYLVMALGVVMSVPGIPGQGFLTILIGLMLVDFPGKYRIERFFIRQPRILRTANRIRKRFKKPAFLVNPRVTRR